MRLIEPACGSLLLIGLALLLLGVDVEHPVIEIPPLDQKPTKERPSPESSIPKRPRYSYPGSLRKLDLDPSPSFAYPPASPKTDDETTRVKNLLAEHFENLRARDRVNTGQIHPGWIDLAERIEQYWHVDFTQIRDPKIAEVSGPWLADTTYKALSKLFLPDRERFYQAERVAGDEASAAASDMLLFVDDCVLNHSLGNKVSTLIEVRFGASGDSEARILSGSGHPLYDAAALDSVRQGLEKDWGDEPPRGPARSIYAMVTEFTILPPLPFFGFSFDEVLGNLQLLYPTKKLLRSNAILLAVYRDSGPQGHLADPSEVNQKTSDNAK